MPLVFMRWIHVLSPVAIHLLAFAWAYGAEQLISIPPGIGNTATLYPMQILQDRIASMRYQQVYAASAFAALEPTNLYLTRIDLRTDENTGEPAIGTTTNLQVRLSTTSRAQDGLSTNFAENVGPDEMVVFAATDPTYIMPSIDIYLYVFILPKPFLYNPARGNLLLEVRAETGGEPLSWHDLSLDANNSPTDAVSRVYAKSADATQATAVDTIGLNTVFHFNPAPSLQIGVESVLGTNRPVVSWPAQPSVFVLQTSDQVGVNAVWQAITNGIGGSPAGPDRWVYLPVQPPGVSTFYRLIWVGGQGPATMK